MPRSFARTACGLSLVPFVLAGCEDKKKTMQQDAQQAAADPATDYLEPEPAAQFEPTAPGTAYPGSSTGAVPSGARVHTVQPKETLSSIAYQYYGVKNWRKIYEANRERISDPNKIHPGMKLIIP